jgi:hypothetical protein
MDEALAFVDARWTAALDDVLAAAPAPFAAGHVARSRPPRAHLAVRAGRARAVYVRISSSPGGRP